MSTIIQMPILLWLELSPKGTTTVLFIKQWRNEKGQEETETELYRLLFLFSFMHLCGAIKICTEHQTTTIKYPKLEVLTLRSHDHHQYLPESHLIVCQRRRRPQSRSWRYHDDGRINRRKSQPLSSFYLNWLLKWPIGVTPARSQVEDRHVVWKKDSLLKNQEK